MTAISLPAGFEDLEAIASQWALPTQNLRQRKRIGSTTAELRALYDTVLPRVEAILAHADGFPVGQLPPDSARLFSLALSLAEVAPHIELYRGNPKVPYSFDEMRFVAEHGEQAA